jgi:hypothetical protein
LTGVQLDGGVHFDFPPITLAPGAYAVVVENRGAFQRRYPAVGNVVGEWSGRLSNDGERLVLTDGLGQTLLDFQYDDRHPWPEPADGAGATLELIDVGRTPTTEYGNSDRWRGSPAMGGTPGNSGPLEFRPGDANGDGVFDQLDIVRLLRAGKYLTGEPATFDEGDFNGDGVFDRLDFIATLRAGHYDPGPQAPLATDAVFARFR